MRKYSFEKLEVWQISKSLIIDIYSLTTTFPENEKFGITNQIRRASFSIANNIAEGNSRTTKRDKSRFIEISYGSLMEVLNILIVSKELNMVSDVQYEAIRAKIEELGNKMNALKKSIST